MKFPLQYAKILSQKYLNIDDDIIPEIEMCLEREGDKVNLPYEVEDLGIKANNDSFGYGFGDGYHSGNGYCNDYSYIDGDGNGDCNDSGNGYGDGDGDGYGYGEGNGDGYGEGDGS